MNASLKDRIVRKMENLPDDRGYQVLDYVEFLESKYAERQAPQANVFTRFAEGIEDTMRAGRISTSAIAQTMDLMNKAMGVLNGVTAAGKSVASDLVTTATQMTSNPLANPPAAPTAPTVQAPPATAATPVAKAAAPEPAPLAPPAPPAQP
jgi:hypothetical protein